MGKPLRQELDEILSQKADADRSDRRTLFQHLDRKKEVVLFGAGNLGRQIATVLHNAGVNIGAFADNQQEIWQTKIEGIPVLPPDKAVSRYGSSAFFLIAMWHPCEKSDVLSATAQLRTLGAKRIAPFSLLLDRFPELLPRLFWSSREELVAHARDIVQTFEQLADETSRGSYLNALRLRLSHDFKAADHVACGKQYFPRDLFRLRNDEVFIDCGAYDGDTMTDFIAECLGKFRKIIAIEADPKNAEKLRRKAVDSGFSHSIETLELVVGSKNGIAKLAANGAASASVCDTGELEVPCTTLDTALGNENPTIIKMDIEGAESEGLLGARRLIAECRPILAICVYHRPSDLWMLPLQMLSLMPNSKIYLRSHCADGFDLVCYVIPEERGLAKLRWS